MSEDLPPSAPGGRPVVGHTLALRDSPLETLERWGDANDSVVRVQIAGRRMVLVSDPAVVREVLVEDHDAYRKASIVTDRLGTLQGGSLVLLEGEAWRNRRETVRSAFAPGRIAGTAALTTRYAANTVAEWPDGGVVRADEHARDLSLSILARTLFGLDLRGGETPIHEAAEDVLARMDLGSVSAYLPEWVPTPTNRRFRRAVATLHDRLDATVEERTSPAGDDREMDLLSTLSAAGLETERIRDELVAFLFAGFDSTATALSCTLGLLGDHPDLQADLRTEIDNAVGDRSPTSEDLDDLSLLDAVVRESLRLYPPQYLLFREPTEPVTLAGYRIPAGTTVVLAPWLCHRDERFWGDPESFKPRRWLDPGPDPSTDEERPRFAYFPYGGGPRHCIGMRMANQIIRLVVAEVCRRRRLELVGEVAVSAGPTLSLDGGVKLRTRTR